MTTFCNRLPLIDSFTQHHSENISETLLKEPCCLGVDEAGRGPVLGPMVYSVGYCPISRQAELRERGMDDSKKLTAETRAELFSIGNSLNEWFGWSVHVLSPQDISRSMLRRLFIEENIDLNNRNKYNLNEMSHDTAIMLIQSVLARGVNVKEIFVDTVGPPEKYQTKLEALFPNIKINVAKKADSLYPIVSAASICAKVARDEILENWVFPEKGFGDMKLDTLGSGYPSDPNTQKWLSENIDKVFGFPNLIRFSWSTSTVLLDKSAISVEWQCEQEEEEFKFRKMSQNKKTNERKLFKKLGASSVYDI